MKIFVEIWPLAKSNSKVSVKGDGCQPKNKKVPEGDIYHKENVLCPDSWERKKRGHRSRSVTETYRSSTPHLQISTPNPAITGLS